MDDKDKVTPERINSKVEDAHYFAVPDTGMTICAILLSNGFVVTGQSAATQVEFDADKGKELAFADALKKIWPLEMYLLREKMAGGKIGEIPKVAIKPHDDLVAFIGTKIVNAKPMTRAVYCQLRGWDIPADENGDDEGYFIEYTDAQRPNVPGFEGFVSWSPKDVFEQAYDEYKTTARKSETPQVGELFLTKPEDPAPLPFDA